MPRIVITHPVEDVEKWVSHKDERAAFFADYGSDVVDFLPTDGSKNIAVSVNVRDMEGLQAALETPGAKEIEKSHGVLEPISVFAAS